MVACSRVARRVPSFNLYGHLYNLAVSKGVVSQAARLGHCLLAVLINICVIQYICEFFCYIVLLVFHK